jgi:hypothetical protein
MNRVALAFVLLVIPVLAQNPQGKHPTVDEMLQRGATYEFRNVSAERGGEIVDFLQRRLGQQTVALQWYPAMKTVVIYPFNTDNSDDVEKVIGLLKKYDVAPPPKPEIEFTAYLVVGSLPGQAPAFMASTGPNTTKITMPPISADLQSALTQMKLTLADRTYWLHDTVVTRVTSNADVDGVTGIGLYPYTVSYREVGISPDGKSIRISPFRFGIKPCSGNCSNVGISTDSRRPEAGIRENADSFRRYVRGADRQSPGT